MPLANFQLIFAFFGWKRPSQNFNHFFRFIKFAPSFILDQMIAFMIRDSMIERQVINEDEQR